VIRVCLFKNVTVLIVLILKYHAQRMPIVSGVF